MQPPCVLPKLLSDPSCMHHTVEKPASEKGASAMAQKAGTEMTRIGADIGKKLGKLSFGWGKKK